MGKSTRWTKEEDAFLIREYGKSASADIAEALGKTPGAIKSRAIRLNIKFRDKGPDNIPDGFKYCKFCKSILSIDSFHNKSSSKDGRSHMCKECSKGYDRKRREKKKDQMIKNQINETNKEINEKNEWKNSKIFFCKECKKNLPGEKFSFNNNGGRVSGICNSCKSKKSKITTCERIKVGKGW